RASGRRTRGGTRHTRRGCHAADARRSPIRACREVLQRRHGAGLIRQARVPRGQALKPNALVLLDSSAILAVLDRADQNHAAALRAATQLARLRCRLFQSTWLRAETHALLIARVGADPARRWLSSPPSPTVRPDAADEARGEAIVKRYRDKDFSLCDAVSF